MGRTRRGVGALEFALTLPFLLLVVVGIVELSLLMHRAQVVTRSARDACRVASGVMEGVDPTGDLIEDAAEEAARLSLLAAGIDCHVVACQIQATWHEVEDWHMIRTVVGVPYTPMTGLMPGLRDVTRSDFEMLTQQQIFD